MPSHHIVWRRSNLNCDQCGVARVIVCNVNALKSINSTSLTDSLIVGKHLFPTRNYLVRGEIAVVPGINAPNAQLSFTPLRHWTPVKKLDLSKA
jgi:hypothetical protein